MQITMTADVLTLRGEFKQEDERKDATYHVRRSTREPSAPWLALGGLFLLGVVIYRRHTNGGRQ